MYKVNTIWWVISSSLFFAVFVSIILGARVNWGRRRMLATILLASRAALLFGHSIHERIYGKEVVGTYKHVMVSSATTKNDASRYLYSAPVPFNSCRIGRRDEPTKLSAFVYVSTHKADHLDCRVSTSQSNITGI